MAATQPSTPSKRGRSIPVKVSIDPRPAQTTLPPVTAAELRPTPTPTKPLPKKTINAAPVFKAVKTPVHEWSEAKRRQLMWWLVGGGMTVIVIGWLAVVRLEMNGDNGQNIFSEAKRLIQAIHWPGTEKKSAAEQEIRNLDTQVFPQFQQSR